MLTLCVPGCQAGSCAIQTYIHTYICASLDTEICLQGTAASSTALGNLPDDMQHSQSCLREHGVSCNTAINCM